MVKTYKEDEDYDFLVVDNPYGMVPPGRRQLDPQSFARLGEWFRVLLGTDYNPIEAVYWTRTVRSLLYQCAHATLLTSTRRRREMKCLSRFLKALICLRSQSWGSIYGLQC